MALDYKAATPITQARKSPTEKGGPSDFLDKFYDWYEADRGNRRMFWSWWGAFAICATSFVVSRFM